MQLEDIPDTIDIPFERLERSDLFVFLREQIQKVFKPSLEAAVKDHDLVVIGGQSLALWARQYLIDEMTGEDIGFLTSDDLDFTGNTSSVKYCEEQLGVKFKTASIDECTPELAIANLSWKDDSIYVDILKMDSVGGVSAQEISKYLAVIDLDGVPVAVIDPVTCLKSRLHNLFAGWQRYKERESVRVKIAIRASECYMREILVYEGFRFAAPYIRRIKDLALSEKGKRIYVEYGIDLLGAIPQDAAILPKDYTEKELPRMQREVSSVRNRKLKLYLRQKRPVHSTLTSDPVVAQIDPR